MITPARHERRSPSGLERKTFYSPSDWEPSRYSADLADPGAFPFTRGIRRDGYREKLWTMRQYAGFGTAEESNARYRYLLEQGQTGLSVALDLPTQLGFDSDDPRAAGEVGRVGVAIDTLDDMERLFRGIDLERVTTSFTINATAAILLAMYVAVAKKAGADLRRISGTVQNDILKEYVARGTWIFPVEPSLRLIVDTIAFCAEQVPRFNAISVAGAHFRDAGATAVQELAFTLSDGITYVERCLARGMDVDDFAGNISFFFYTHTDFFEEVAKYRAARRIWARTMRERFGARSERSLLFRFGLVCGGSSLYAAQPLNNAIRVAFQALASVMAGTSSIFTAAWDEPFAIPTQQSAELALRTQQIIAHETGVADVADPLGGSYYVEALTDATETAVVVLMREIEDEGGMVACIERGYIQQLIADEAYHKQRRIDGGEDVIVGVNRYQTADMAELRLFSLDPSLAEKQRERLRHVRAQRDEPAVRSALERLRAAAAGSENCLPALIAASEAYCTLGEMSTVLREIFGAYRQPIVF
ncbi:MAG: methylmalonyl-CoA mutase [Candidatus Eremiobacteraeota bacterium]|nr:methylmalonyl-CoA mutase [Candidatus Eremiobacteraeota bacterium]MBV8354141.1 methylmalonyl-CoA mutase [Candidatus Eremiobacteraeota bacterium]